MILQDFPLHLMETLKCWCSLRGYIVVFTVLTAIRQGSTCEAPSSPQCFRRKTGEDYMCEWKTNMTDSNLTFVIHFNQTVFEVIKDTWIHINEEELIRYRPVDIWVTAQMGSSSCESIKRTVILSHIVKYHAPKNISMSWSQNNLNLGWEAAEKYRALAEVRFRQTDPHTEQWKSRTMNTTISGTPKSVNWVVLENLLKHTVYQVQVRQRSNMVQSPLWSDWSSVVTVPAELEHEPEFTITTKLVNGTRKVTLKLKEKPHKAAVITGVTYRLHDTQSSHGCPCHSRDRSPKNEQQIKTSVSYSAVNITVVASNAAGSSPPAVIQLQAVPAGDLKVCEEEPLKQRLKKGTCLEFSQYDDGDSVTANVITLTVEERPIKHQLKEGIKDYVRYLFSEHTCKAREPQTVKRCLFYRKEGVPRTEPPEFSNFGETDNSVNLSWKAIPTEDLRGFLTHHRLCMWQINSESEMKECYNISASLTHFRLENLKPGTKYNVTLTGVTQSGEGPMAVLTVGTPTKPVNVLWSLSLLVLFFILSTLSNFIFKRIKGKLFPPVPKPVIPDFTDRQNQMQKEMPEGKEDVDELTLHPRSESAVALRAEWEDSSDEDVESGDSEGCPSPSSMDQALRSSTGEEITDVEQLDNEIAMLIYRNGLVLDVKTD